MTLFSSRRPAYQGFSVVASLVMLGLLVVFSMVAAAVARKQWQSPTVAAKASIEPASLGLSAPPPSAGTSSPVAAPASTTPAAALLETPAPVGKAGSTPPADPP